jgi:hypothetical protein
MTDGNGADPPDVVLAGHLVLYPDMLAFRPDGGDNDTVIYRPLTPPAPDLLAQLLSAGDGGMLATVIAGKLPNPGILKAARALRHG